jgi:methylated-DNA-[protein]-cysteine S-methyltransferase
MQLQLEQLESILGTILLVTDDDGALRALDFAGHENRMHRLLREHYGDYQLRNGKAPREVTRALRAYFDGDVKAVDEVRVETNGTPFQRAVWKGLREIPAGTTKSYGGLAADLQRAGACRAVGSANGSNPVAIVVPCHRVIGANGSLTGFASGLERKEWLLAHERKFSRPPVFALEGQRIGAAR